MWLSHKAIFKSGATALDVGKGSLELDLENGEFLVFLFTSLFLFILNQNFLSMIFVTHNLPTAL